MSGECILMYRMLALLNACIGNQDLTLLNSTISVYVRIRNKTTMQSSIKIVYEKRPCRLCKGQVMTIYVMREKFIRKCIKCEGKGIRHRIRIRPECKEERIGKLIDMHEHNRLNPWS